MKRSMKAKIIGCCTILVLMAGSRAKADESGALDFEESKRVEAYIPYRSPGSALGLSLVSTALLVGLGGAFSSSSGDERIIGNVMIGLGATVGPSVGHFYAGEWGRGLGMSAARAGCIGLVHLGHLGLTNVGLPFIIGGGAGWLVFTLWDIVDSMAAADRFNAEYAPKSLEIAPLVLPPVRNDDSPPVGLALQGRF